MLRFKLSQKREAGEGSRMHTRIRRVNFNKLIKKKLHRISWRETSGQRKHKEVRLEISEK